MQNQDDPATTVLAQIQALFEEGFEWKKPAFEFLCSLCYNRPVNVSLLLRGRDGIARRPNGATEEAEL